MNDVLLKHQAVMPGEILDYLNLSPGKKILDCTVGTGGHAKLILPKILPGGYLVGIDYDNDTIRIAEDNLKEFQGNFKLVKDNFKNLDSVLKNLNLEKVDGVIMDLGISSWQLNDANRGLSFMVDGPLDMRVDKNLSLSAKDYINSASFEKLDKIIDLYGEEPFHRRIANRIIEARQKAQITTTKELEEIIFKAVPYSYKFRKTHPATKTFMALRIAVNNELENLEESLTKVFGFMSLLSRICVISFHSLEDRIVKNRFKELKLQNIIKIITKKPVTPTEVEIDNNSRSRSAKLRVAEKI